MKEVKKFLLKFKPIRDYINGKNIADNIYYRKGRNLLKDSYYVDASVKNQIEISKKPSRTVILNFLLRQFNRDTKYLEIGVRNPNDNFNLIIAETKISVDPGLEFKENPVDFKMTSNEFFGKLKRNKILNPTIKFDVIFIDGLHLAHQVNTDIKNAFKYLAKDGFIVLHDCNPPTEWHTRYEFNFKHSPASGDWNGTTWKAFLRWRCNPDVFSCCIDCDYGIGILTKNINIGNYLDKEIEFYEYNDLDNNRKEYLNLINYNNFNEIISQQNNED